MFGLFKKKATPGEMGYGVLHYTAEFLAADAGQSLGMRFDGYDASGGWANSLERKGITVPTQKLYFRLFTHCAIQAACTQFDEAMRRAITQGAMESFTEKLDGYSFETTYTTLRQSIAGNINLTNEWSP